MVPMRASSIITPANISNGSVELRAVRVRLKVSRTICPRQDRSIVSLDHNRRFG